MNLTFQSLKNSFVNGSVLPQETELVVEGAETLINVRNQVLKLTSEIQKSILQNENGHIQKILKTLNNIRNYVADKTAQFLKEADVIVTNTEVLQNLENEKTTEKILRSLDVTNFTKNKISHNSKNESESSDTRLEKQNSNNENNESSKEEYEPDSDFESFNYDYNNDENEEAIEENFSKESKKCSQNPENPNCRLRLIRDLSKRDHDSNLDSLDKVVRPIETSIILFPFFKKKE